MPARTRRQAAFEKNNAKAKTSERDNDNDSWGIPESNLKSSIIKTYSKKQPFRTYWTSGVTKINKSNQESQDVPPKRDNSVTSPKMELSQATLSLTENTTPASIRKSINMWSCNVTILNSSVKKARNKTRIGAESMVACTMLSTRPSGDVIITEEDMSLCSVVQGKTQDQDMMIRNSTVLADCRNVKKDFVPNEISAIEGESELQDTVVRNCNELTPEKQEIQTATQSAKKVRFGVSQKGTKATKKKQGNQTSAAAKRSILRKTPLKKKKLQDPAQLRCQKTSSPDPNKQASMLHCEISTLLIDDCPTDKKSCTHASSSRMTQDTEKLLDFEPVPFKCSNDVESSPRDVTPETCNSEQAPTSSVKRRRRLSYPRSYHFDENVPACILLDYPVSKTTKTATILSGNCPHFISVKEAESFPDDILL